MSNDQPDSSGGHEGSNPFAATQLFPHEFEKAAAFFRDHSIIAFPEMHDTEAPEDWRDLGRRVARGFTQKERQDAMAGGFSNPGPMLQMMAGEFKRAGISTIDDVGKAVCEASDEGKEKAVNALFDLMEVVTTAKRVTAVVEDPAT